jgi:predicted AlkP superfamily phosphohydrolase/phosphomutase
VRRILRRKFGAAARVDWTRTQVFQLPTDRNSYLRINLRGREPGGIVAPGAGYEQLLALIEREFRALVNVETGQPAVEEVFRVHELYPGPRVEDLPDLAILWSSAAPINIVESPRLGRLALRAVEDRSGNHRAEGFLLARGPGIRPGAKALHGDILQVPATLLALHGLPCPAHYEMPPLADLLVSEPEAHSQSRVA